MKYRRLGNSDLMLSEIALGSWLTYGWLLDPSRSAACIRHALDRGINFIDTANAYALGGVEEFLGGALAEIPRDRYVLATKLYFPMGDTGSGLSREQIAIQLDASLRRLRTDYVDLYQCHRFDMETQLEETMEALARAVEAGKIRYVGFSEWTPAQIEQALGLSSVLKFVSSQPQYSILWRTPEQRVLDLCAEHGIGSVVWSPLAQGVLTGKYLPGREPPLHSRAVTHQMPESPARAMLDNIFRNDHVLAAVQRLVPIAERLGLTVAQLSLSWVLRQPAVTAAIIGATSSEQIDENCGAAGITLDPEALQHIDEATAAVAQR